MNTLRTCAAAAVVLLLTACTKVNSGVGGVFNFDTDLKIIFDVASNINPDEKHTPSPLYLRFYELKSDQRFSQANFLELYEEDAKVLGDQLVSKRELRRIAPGEKRTEKFVVDTDTRYVALFAEFFQFKNARFKVVFPVTSNNVIENTVRVEINDTSLLLRSAK